MSGSFQKTFVSPWSASRAARRSTPMRVWSVPVMWSCKIPLVCPVVEGLLAEKTCITGLLSVVCDAIPQKLFPVQHLGIVLGRKPVMVHLVVKAVSRDFY